MKPPVSNRCAGFTLVEAVVTMVILSIAALAMGQTLGLAFSKSSDGLWQARSVALAQSYLEEIMGHRYDEATPVGGVPACAPGTTPCSAIGPESGESRPTFDDVDDYHGLADAPPQDSDGNSWPVFAGYAAAVTVRYVTAAEVTSLGLDTTTDAKVVTVAITPPGRDPLTFTVLRANF